MKTLKTQLRPITLFLILLMLLQSCTVYKSATISLDQAVQNQSKVRVKTINNEKFKFKRIGVENGNYYGIKKTKGEMVKTPLNEEFIASVKEKDETASTLGTIMLGTVLGGCILLGISIANGVGGFD